MFENITLELSLKPFKRTDECYIRSVCSQIFEQWRPLLKNRRSIKLMLWSADGSELLDYAGVEDDTFEWCRFVGTANLPYPEPDDPLELSLHKKKRDYTENPPKMTYGILKRIVSCLKEEGAKAFPSAVISVGSTFDIGPEFSLSDFKYARHTEICSGIGCGGFGFIDSTATLHADTHRYAAYPTGIPEGTPFGSFLGKQAEVFLSDMGFDYLWLSNGLGFSSNPWDKTGKIFDGERYYPEKLAKTKQSVFDFWRLFRAECSFPLEVRGTNNSVGIDYATDGVPLYDIYNADLNITAPPNSPWAAINDDYGLELMGHMTRICELPGKCFPFRYYLHDPWWINSPWYDRYDGSPCDVYLPMAISRINPEGKIETASSLGVLSIDNSYGDMPDQCVNEPMPHFLKAEKDAADEAAPLVWVYPMREYTTSHDVDTLREMNLGDNYISNAINRGLPLCCVTSTDSFLRHADAVYQKSSLISPVPQTPAVLERLLDLTRKGIGVVIYGTKRALATLPNDDSLIRLDVEESADCWQRALCALGCEISFDQKEPAAKPPTMALLRCNNALFFSVYNANTTTDAHFRFLLGAPILCGCETELKDGRSAYRFARSEHRECRVFVEQSNGVISCREAPPINVRYRRAIKITGLENATVRLFSEKGCESAVSIAKNTDRTPEFDPRFYSVSNPVHGDYLEGKGISGSIYFLIGHKS